METKYTEEREDTTNEVRKVKVYMALTEEDLETIENIHRMGDEMNKKMDYFLQQNQELVSSTIKNEEFKPQEDDIEKEFEKYGVTNIWDYILKRLEYLLSLFDKSSISNKETNSNGDNMENKQEGKIKNEYEHPILLEDFINVENPVFDTEGNIRDKGEKEINKGIVSRKPVTIIESADLRKIQNDYRNQNYQFQAIMDNFNKLTIKLDNLTNTVDEQKQEIKGLRKENSELKQEVTGLRDRINVLEETNRNLVSDNQRLRNAQIPSVSIVNQHNKRARRDEVYGSDNEGGMQNVPLVDKGSESRDWSPGIGLRDTFSIFTPRGVLTQEKQENELRRAAYNGDIGRLRSMLARNKSIVNGRGMPDSLCSVVSSFKDKTALMLAVQEGHIECVKELLKNGASVNLWDRDKQTALNYATQYRHREVYKLLTEAHALPAVEVPELNREDEVRKHKLT